MDRLGRSRKASMDIPPRNRWHGDLTSTLGRNVTSNLRSTAALGFTKRLEVCPVPKQSTDLGPGAHLDLERDAKRLAVDRTVKWMSADKLAAVEQRERERVQREVVPSNQRWHGDVRSGLGRQVESTRRTGTMVAIKSRPEPPTGSVLIQKEAYNMRGVDYAPDRSTFGRQVDSRLASSTALRFTTPTPEKQLSPRTSDQQWPAKQRSSLSRKGARISKRPEVMPVPKTAHEAGPAAYEVASSFGKKIPGGYMAPHSLNKSGSRASTALGGTRRRLRSTKSTGSLIRPPTGPTSLKEWHDKNVATPSLEMTATRSLRPVTAPIKDGTIKGYSELPECKRLSDWLHAFGQTDSHTPFKHWKTKRADRSRGLRTGMKGKASGFTVEQAKAALEASEKATKEMYAPKKEVIVTRTR